MPVEVRIPTIFRKFTDGEPVAEVEPGTLAQVIERLDAHHPGIKEQILGADGDLHRFVNVYVNDEDARYLGKLDAEIADGDTVSLLPSVAGGAPTRA